MLLPQFQMSLQTRRRCLRGLVNICGECGILPNSYTIPQHKAQKLGDSPISSKVFSDTWSGMYEEDKSVTIKVMRYHESDDIREIKKVRYFDPYSPYHDRTLPFAELFPRGHNLEAPVSSEHIGVNWGHD